MTLTPAQFMPLRAGPELDRAVRRWVFGSDHAGRAPCYSTDSHHAMSLLVAMPLTVGRYADRDPEFTAERPYFARFTLGPVNQPMPFVVNAPTPEVALCKAALLYVVEGGEVRRNKLNSDSDAVPEGEG